MAQTRQKYPQGCPTGDAVLTGAGKLAAQYVIHAVGPVWSGGDRGEQESLASAYRKCLDLAVENGCGSVACPSLSTGAYRYPVDLAAGTALSTVISFLKENQKPAVIRFVLFDDPTYAAYEAALRDILEKGQRNSGTVPEFRPPRLNVTTARQHDSTTARMHDCTNAQSSC